MSSSCVSVGPWIVIVFLARMYVLEIPLDSQFLNRRLQKIVHRYQRGTPVTRTTRFAVSEFHSPCSTLRVIIVVQAIAFYINVSVR